MLLRVSIVRRVERSETHRRQVSDPPGPVGAVCNRTISVNLRKELVCSRAIHCASYIQRKEAQ